MMFVESVQAPISVASPHPRFSWQLPAESRHVIQSAYQIMVATDVDLIQKDQPDLWDSGRVHSNQSTHVAYEGHALASNTSYLWTVRVWNQAGEPICDMSTQTFSTTLLNPEDWHAKWIGMGDPDEPQPDPAIYQLNTVTPDVAAFKPNPRSPLLRKTFELPGPVRRARAFICGLGLSVLHLNGIRISDDQLSTPRTEFRKRALFNTYDVTDLLHPGDNAICVILGNGWFNGQKDYWGWQMQWYGSPRAIVQLEIEFEDGSTDRLITDETWQGSWGPTLSSCLFDGEVYDARLEQPGWDQPCFDATAWLPVNLVPSPTQRLEAATCDASRITDRIRPVSMAEPQSGALVLDLGRNIAGWVRLRVQHAKPGSEIRLRYGEAVHEDGTLDNTSQNRAKQIDRYICKGGDIETWEPSFTYHGFQFVEVTGAPESLDLDSIEGCFVRTAVPQIGHFACSNDLVNRIHQCTLQSVLCNVQMGVPTDDTQRPERQGWGADAWAIAHDAFYNVDMTRVYTKWAADFRDQQQECGVIGMITPQAGFDEDLVWSAAFVLIPWWQYLYTGDRRILEDNYESFKRYLEYLEQTGVREVDPEPTADILAKLFQQTGPGKRFPVESQRGHLQFAQWGDHLSLADGHTGRSNAPLSIATAFYFLDATTMARIAETLGYNEDAQHYRQLAESINTAFHERFYDQARRYYDTGTQAAQAWPLAFGMVPQAYREHIEARLIGDIATRQRHLSTGYAATRYAIEALANANRHDVIWKLATATDYPSWGYMLRLNRTTSCERWDGEAGSLNHAPLGAAIDEWFYSGLAGIRPDPQAPGYQNVIIKPYMPADLQWAQASVQTLRGRIRSAWKKTKTHTMLDVCIPANSTATIYIASTEIETITESDQPLTEVDGVIQITADDRHTRVQIGSGNYHFQFISCSSN